MRATNSSQQSIGTTVVMFTLRDQQLNLLLVNRSRKGKPAKWALPGGQLHEGKDIEQSVRQELETETGVTGVYLEQLYTCQNQLPSPDDWGITVAHYALFPLNKLHVRKSGDVVNWFPLEQLPKLQKTHQEIVGMARSRLAAKLDYSTIAFQFLAEQFTLRELQDVYEIILQQPLDKRNFRKSVLTKDYITETGTKRRNGAHRPAMLYQTKTPGRVEFTK